MVHQTYADGARLLARPLRMLNRSANRVADGHYDEPVPHTDRMKSTFLHYISNQMIVPGDLIDKSVTKLCNNYHNANMKEIEQEIKVIKQQSTEMLKLLGHIIEAVQMESGKEGSHE